MTAPPRILIAGAGIGGLTAALALRHAGFAITLIEAAPQLEEVGAGIQLSPNASRILIALGLGPALARHAVAPAALRVMNLRSGREIVRASLDDAQARYGGPFWVIHRAELQYVLAQAVAQTPDIDVHLGVRVEDFAQRDNRVIVGGRGRIAMVQFEGDALVVADGIWSRLRARLGVSAEPVFRGQTAWRALIPTEDVQFFAQEAATNLWLGPQAHVVHYPVSSGALVNVVAIVRENWDEEEWSAPGDPDALRARAAQWPRPLRDLVALPQRWEKWALNELPPLSQWGAGPVTLLGDAAHAMRPFLAQGAAMAIEDAAVLADCLSQQPYNAAGAMRDYEAQRMPRTARVQREAAQQAWRYGMRWPLSAARDLALSRMGGERLLARYDWLYGWQPA